jgi:hypothetical protein
MVPSRFCPDMRFQALSVCGMEPEFFQKKSHDSLRDRSIHDENARAMFMGTADEL